MHSGSQERGVGGEPLRSLYSRIIARCVTVHRKDKVLRTHRFEPLEITLIVENRSFLPVAFLNVIDQQNTFSPANRGASSSNSGPEKAGS